MQDYIFLKNVKVHNLKINSLKIPKRKLVVICGVSGSGKSSLALDTLFAEGQRRYVESLSSYARQFLGVMKKPEADKIEGISPAIAIEQKGLSKNPRSIVGTATEIYDYLRLLFARVGEVHCPKCGRKIQKQTLDEIVDKILKIKDEVYIFSPAIFHKKGQHKKVLEEIERAGFLRVRVDKTLITIEEALDLDLDPKKRHTIEVLVDKFFPEKEERSRIADSCQQALKIGKGIFFAFLKKEKKEIPFSEKFSCPKCNIALPEIEPRLFSFNSPLGACPLCGGLGETMEVDKDLVVPDKNLSLAEGAIAPWAYASHKIGRQSYFWWKLKELSQDYNFSLYTPFKNLPENIQDILLYGDGYFEGVVPFLERKWKQAESEAVREEIEKYMRVKTCSLCHGQRLKKEALSVKFFSKSIWEITEMTIEKAKKFFEKCLKKLKGEKRKIGEPILKEIIERLNFLEDVGVGYLSLSRKTGTLSGGEGERIRLASQLGAKLTGITYILDEPSIGLHPRDLDKLIKNLKKLRDLENTVIVVEHDPKTILSADWVIEIGPGAGKKGGRVVFEGKAKKLLLADTLTAKYLKGELQVKISQNFSFPKKYLVVVGAREHNLKNITVKFPLGKFICVTGVSGSGKSTLVNDILGKALMKKFYQEKEEPGLHQKILGWENLKRVRIIDQSPIGKTPRSNPVTYISAFSHIREIFANQKEARIRGYTPSKFSFNLKDGRCEACQGQGYKKVEMYFLPDMYVECEVCKGKRYQREVLEIEFKGKNIAEVLEMSVDEAFLFFKKFSPLERKLKTLKDVGLGYIELGQPAPTLSGGEAQRVKLAEELCKKESGDALYILDEPTVGLHPDDISKLLKVLEKLKDRGNTIIVIEHNLDVIKNADWIIDLGPEGGDKGGEIVAEGPPKEIAKNKKSYTGKFLKKVL